MKGGHLKLKSTSKETSGPTTWSDFGLCILLFSIFQLPIILYIKKKKIPEVYNENDVSPTIRNY